MYIHVHVVQHSKLTTDLRVVLYEEEEDDVLSLVLNGQVQGEVAVGLEHVVEQRSTQVSKVPRVEVVL